MARKSKKTTKKVEKPPPAVDTEEESVHDDDDGDAKMDTEDGIPDIADKDSSDEDEDEAVEETKSPKGSDKKSKKKDKKTKDEQENDEPKNKKEKQMIPFMDTFYQLSSEDSPKERSFAARDLIHHCFLSEEQGTNKKDAAYALTRLMNGVCTGRAASRQGFASCLSSFLRVAYSSSDSAMEDILKEDETVKQLKEDMKADDDVSAAMIVRLKLLSTTQFLSTEVADNINDNNTNKKGQTNKKNKFGGGMKGIEERDHAFGRLFGILAVVRSGVLGLKDFPSEVVEGYTQDLIDLYHYKKWMKEPAAHAIIELLSSLDTTKSSNHDLIAKVTNNVIIPAFFLPKGNDEVDLTDRAQLLPTLTPEQIAVALHLQTPRSSNDYTIKFRYPLDKPLVTSKSIPKLSAALASTSSVVQPRCHVVWNALWMYLTEETKAQEGHRHLRSSGEGFPSIIEGIIEHVVLGILLGKGQITTPTDERKSLALQIVCALSGSSSEKIVLPSNLMCKVLSPEIVTRVFVNVVCASGGGSQAKKGKEHHLKPLTFQALVDLIDCCCEHDDVDRRMAFAKAFILADPRFDTKTKTQAVSTLLMIEDKDGAADNTSDGESSSKKESLLQAYLSFLEEEIVSSSSLHNATLYIELMYKFAKRDLHTAPANEARRVVRFFMSGAFFDCSDLSDPSAIKKTPSKKKKKAKTASAASSSPPPQELSSGLRIKEVLKANDMTSIPHTVRAVMAGRFYSLLFDLILVINSQNKRVGKTDKTFYEKGSSKPESIYRSLSEISGICSLLESSGAKKFPAPSASVEEADDDASDAEDTVEASRKSMLQVQKIADDALVKECDGSGDKDILRAKAVFATGCASLMMSLHLQLNSCGNADEDNVVEEDEENAEVTESVHEYISDLADCVDGFCQFIEDDKSSSKKNDDDDEENPLAMMAGLLVNILSSPVGGEGKSSASKLSRETIKLSWSGIISVITSLNEKNKSIKSLVDEDVMSILIESVCGEKSMGDEDKGEDDDDESMEESVGSDDGLGDSAVFVDASAAGMDLDDVKGNNSDDSEENEDDISRGSKDKDGGEDVELDPTRLENLLLEDSDAEMSDSGFHGILEHHAGADKALAQLIKLKQDARKASQTERERIELGNRLRCAGLLDSLFAPTVFKSGWLPVEAVLGSIVPILRSCKAIEKSIHADSSANAKKSLNEKKALLERLYSLMKDKISKFRCSDGSSTEELALKASSDIYEEMKRSPSLSHCTCCSVALITAVRCIPNVEDSDVVKDIYGGAIDDWSSRRATKIHSCVFDNLINRIPSLASLILVEPLMAAVKGAHSPFMKCESIKLLSSIYNYGASNSEEVMLKESKSALKQRSTKVVETLKDMLGDSNLRKAKNGDEVLIATKHFIQYVKAQDEGILTDTELCSLQDALKTIKGSTNRAGTKKMCTSLSETISSLARRDDAEEQKPKRPKAPKTPKSSKKPKKSKK